MTKKAVGCPLETTLRIIEGRWRGLILRELLLGGTKRFGELHRSLVGISHRVLTQELRALEQHGVIHREVFLQVPPKVEYSLTRVGHTLKPVLFAMSAWGKQYERKRGPLRRAAALA